MIEISIHAEACRGCELCVDVCPTDVLAFDAATRKAKVSEPRDCIGCLSCRYTCPSNALTYQHLPLVKNFYRDLNFSQRMARFL